MKQPLISKLDTLDRELQELCSQLGGISFEQFNSSPAPNKWSAAQIMNHLMLAEAQSLRYCQRKLSHNPDLPKVGIRTYLRSTLLCSTLHLPIKIKAPQGFDTEFLPEQDSLENVLERWHAQRIVLRGFVQEIPEKYLNKEVYKHPMAGRTSLGGMLSFFRAHFRHHQPQILKAISTNTGKSSKIS